MAANKLERKFQKALIDKLMNMFDGCEVIKLDPNYIQGVPDLLILFNDKWATLECKRSSEAERQPNQETYVDRYNAMSFSRFIYPENEAEVLNELREFFFDKR